MMSFYLDDDIMDRQLLEMLRRAGHLVTAPNEIGMAGEYDPVHLKYAIENRLVMMTRNAGDFGRLHKLVIAAGGHHPGVLVVRFDNDRSRDMKPHHIINVIAKLERLAVPIADQLLILNAW